MSDPVVVEVGAGGDDLSLDREVASPFHLAEIGFLASPDQRLEALFPGGAHDLDLEVAAAGGASASGGGGAL